MAEERDKLEKVDTDDELNRGYFNDLARQTIIGGQNLIRSLIDRAGVYSADLMDWWGDAYIDSNGRDDSVISATAGFDTNKYKAVTSDTEPFIIMEATSISNLNHWDINDCDIAQMDSGKWILRCTTGTDEVKRAQLIKTLFYGTDGTNPRASSTYITGITALKTNVTRDVGKRGHYAKLITSYTGTGGNQQVEGFYTGTFADTSTNTDCSSWSNVSTGGNTTAQPYWLASWEIAEGTTRNSQNYVVGSVDEIGTDTSGDETDNPADCQLDNKTYHDGVWYGTTTTDVIILCSGDISWAYTYTGADIATYTNTDFYTDNSIPDFTLATENVTSLITHTIPSGTFSSTISSAIGTAIVEDWETGAEIQFKLTNTGGDDSGWLDYNEISNFTAFTAEPDTMIVKLIPKTTSPTSGYPSIKGFAVRSW